jgi:hypothetical protein
MDELTELPFQGTSMWPCLRPGDLLLVTLNYEKQIKHLKPGDIVLERNSDEWVAHRLVSLSESHQLAIKGDRSNTYTLFDSKNKVWGKVCGYQREKRRVRFSQETSLCFRWIAFLSEKTIHSDGWCRKFLKILILTSPLFLKEQ